MNVKYREPLYGRLLEHLAPFLVILLLFFSVESLITCTPFMRWLDHKDSHYFLQTKLDLYRQADPQHMDVLAIGTSHTELGFDPATFEAHAPVPLHSFNMGVSGFDSILNYFQLKYLVETYGKPKLVLLEITDFEVNTNRGGEPNQRSLSILIRNNPGMLAEIMRSPFYSYTDKVEILCNLSAIYRYRAFIRPDSLVESLKAFWPERHREYHQWEPAPAIYPGTSLDLLDEQSLKLVRQYMKDAEFTSVSNFTPILAYCRQQGIPVVLISWPCYREYTRELRQHPNVWVFDSELNRLNRLYTYPYLDLTQGSLEDPTDYYRDILHLSGTGARYYSGILAYKLFQLPLVRSVFRDQLSRRSGGGHGGE